MEHNKATSMATKKTWWLHKDVDDVITAKRLAYKAWKTGNCTRTSYDTARCIARRVVHHARNDAINVVYESIDCIDLIYCVSPIEMRIENVVVLGDRPVKNEGGGEMPMCEEAKQKVWSEPFQRISAKRSAHPYYH